MNTLQAYKGRHTRDTRTAAGRQHRGQPAAMLRAPFCVCGRGQCALREGQQAAVSERAGCFQKLPPRITQTLQVRTEFLALHRECPVARQSSSSTGAAGNEAGGQAGWSRGLEFGQGGILVHSAHGAEGPSGIWEQGLGEPHTAPLCSDSQLLLEVLLFCGMAQREAEEAAQSKVLRQVAVSAQLLCGCQGWWAAPGPGLPPSPGRGAPSLSRSYIGQFLAGSNPHSLG